jgi:hypothetical protein
MQERRRIRDEMSTEERLQLILENYETREDNQFNQLELSSSTSVLERHAQTILISVITAAILFSATFMYNANEKVSTLATKLEFMSSAITKLELKIDSMNSNYVQKADFGDLEKRVRELEEHKLTR